MRVHRVWTTLFAAAMVLASAQGAAAAHPVKVSGSGTIPGTWHVDLDRGVFKALYGEDLKFDVVSDTERFLQPDPPTRLRKMGATKPSFATCAGAVLKVGHINVNKLPSGTYVCVKTGAGRLARVRIDNVHAAPGGTDLAFVTWAH
jgi:hypothetical protein